MTCEQSGSHPNCNDDHPAENITRVSTRASAAAAHADPTAIPTSMLLMAQGFPTGFSSHSGQPQYPQFNPIGMRRVPIRRTASPCRILSASRSKNLNPDSSALRRIASANADKSSQSSTSAISIISTPFPFGAVRAAVIIRRAASTTKEWRTSLSFVIIIAIFKIIPRFAQLKLQKNTRNTTNVAALPEKQCRHQLSMQYPLPTAWH